MAANFYTHRSTYFCLVLLLILLQGMPRLLSAQSYKIMPLGNSITEGTEVNPSYRDDLYYSLTDAYISFDYVGSKTSLHPLSRPTPLPLCNIDPGTISLLAHEGHWGWRAEDIINGRPDAPTEGKLAEWLQGYTPDVVLMHVGTKDMFQNQPVAETLDELREIVQILRQDNPKVIILMAKLFPAHAPVVGPTAASNINLLNNNIPALVQELHTAMSPILLVDQNTDFDPTPGMHSYDGVHPDRSGASQMARRWYDDAKNCAKQLYNSPYGKYHHAGRLFSS